MTTQPSLFRPLNPVPHPGDWTNDQRTAWELICSTPRGVYADELGARVHAHDDDERCEDCARRGLQLYRSVAVAPHVIKRRTGKIEPRDPQYRAVEPSVQLTELPADFFGAAA